MPATPTNEKVPMSQQEHCASCKNTCVSDDSTDTGLSANEQAIAQLPLINPEKRVELPYTRLFTPASARIPLAKSLAHRKLRKYASETCFSLNASSISDLLSNDQEEPEMSTTAKHKVFSVRPVKSTASGMVLQDGTLPGNQRTRPREDSEGETSYSGSEATLASGSITPILQHKSRRFRLNRPKSATQIPGTPASSDVYNTVTSATVRSIDSLQRIGLGMAGSIDGRRDSAAYNLDDDSLHEFDDQKGKGFQELCKHC
ncbi:unnamed protein product [Gongylonema pulchrum]|uniref:CARMIL_C domain-containing protein n=1 Tax=Gongylonema pulchrum TaxID=637853 RepID=A0A183CX03_9BILA|nr:unnamed protein product [Gongylonema pulchrum]